jgi:hypothetical protein
MGAKGEDGGERRTRHLRAAEGSPRPVDRVAHLRDFLVDCEDGTPVGVVEDVLTDADGTITEMLVAVGGLVRPRVTSITPDEIVAIRPLERRIIVSRAPEPRPRRWWRRG